MAGYSTFNGHRCKLYRFLLFGVSLLFLVWGCGSDPSEQGTSDKLTSASTDSGSASFAIQWHGVSANRASAPVRQAIDDCSGAGVASITCEVYDESNSLIASGGPWDCSDHQGTIVLIPTGSNRMFALLGWNATGGGGDAVYQGQTGYIITINPGKIADAGTIDAYPFVPHLSGPANGQTLTVNSFSLTWDSVATANQYRILVSEDGGFASPIIDALTSETTFAPNNLSASATYHWKIRSIDMQGNESADSEAWHFSTEAIETCGAPALDPIGNRQVDEGATLTFTVNAEDPDSDALTFTHSSLPQGATFDNTTQTFNWTPGYGMAGNYPVTFTVCDDCPDGSLCDSEKIAITVGDRCRPPELSPIGNRQVDEVSTLTFTINAEDPDGSNLSYSTSSLPQGAAFDSETRIFSWTPDYGMAGNYPVTFKVCDDCPDDPLCDQEQIDITVGNVCRAPVLTVPGDQQVDEGDDLTFTVGATDPDGGTLTYSAGNLPDGAKFDKASRTFTWTPGSESAGEHTVTFKVCDDCPDGSLCDQEPVTITVGDVCRSPVLTVPGDQQVDEGDNLTFTVSATDLDGGTLTYSAGNLPDGADFDEDTRTFTWTTGSESAGEYTVTFKVCDDCPDGSLCDQEPVTITVGNVCRAPVLTVPGDQQVNEGDDLTFTVSATDLDGGTLTYSAGNLPDGADFDEDTRTFTWATGSESAGEYTATFKVCDDCPDGSLCDERKVSIEVIPLLDAPILSTPIDGMEVDNGCRDKTEPIEWDFEWKEVPGAVQYQIYVIHTGSKIPLINAPVSGADYHYSDYGYIAETNRYEWTWHVRAMNKDKKWSNWSEWGYFNVEPLDADCMVYGMIPINYDHLP